MKSLGSLKNHSALLVGLILAAALTGCQAVGSRPSAPGATGSLVVASASLNFGTVAVGNSKTMNQTVTNQAGVAVTITGASASGSGFQMGGPPLPLTLAAGQSTAINVTFAPKTAGTPSGTISLTTDLPSAPTITFSVTGTAVAAGQVAANPASLSFGSVQMGSSKSLSVTVTNSGGSSVTISQATTSGPGFSLAPASLPITLGAAQNTTFSVTFTPQSAGSASGNLTVTSNASNPTLNVPLSGSAAGPGQLTPTPSSLAFGNVPVGGSLPLSVQIANSGGSSVTVSQASVSGTGFSLAPLSLPATLGVGQNLTVGVTFTPISAGAASGSLTVSSNGSNPTLNVGLSGTGSSPGTLTITPAAVNFGNVVVGTNQAQTATLSASGSSVTVNSVGGTTSEFSVTGLTLPVTIAAGQSLSITERFAPQTSGSASTTISFGSNAGNSPLTQALSGTGTPAPQHSVDLSWNASASAVVGYNVYRGSQSGGPYAQINSALNASTTYTDATVLGGQTYFYVVTAVDGNNVESPFSNQVQAVVPSP